MTSTPEQLTQLLSGPAGTPPAGVTPDPNNLSSDQKYTILVLVLGLTFSTLAIVIRTYTKIFLMKTRAYEDYVVLVAWLGTFVQVFPYVKITQYGGGIHVWNISLETLSHLIYWTSVAGAIYAPVIFLIKLSILLQFLRIFAPTREGNMFIFVGAHVWILINLIMYSALEFSAIFACNPREKAWMPWLEGRCLNVDAIWKATGLFNCLSDFAVLALPLPSVWSLQIPARSKLLMLAVFATGLCACVAAVIRTYYTWMITQSTDFSYNLVPFGIWTYIELAIGIIISCLPVIPRFFQHFGPRIRATFSISTASKTKSGYGTGLTLPPCSSNNNTPVASKRNLPFTKQKDRRSRSDVDGELTELDGPYVTLGEESEGTGYRKIEGEHRRCAIGLGDLKRERVETMGDPEEGKGGIRVERTTRIEMIPRTEEDYADFNTYARGDW